MSVPSILTALGLEIHETAADKLQAVYGKPIGGPHTSFWRFDTSDETCRVREVEWNGGAWVWLGATYGPTMTTLPASGPHTHPTSDVTSLDTALSGKAAASHTHAASDVTGTAVVTSDSRLSDARTPTAHTHNASDVNAGTLGIARIPTGQTSSTVPFGDDSRFTNARAPTTLLSTGAAGPTAVGYATGAGGTVTQATSKTTGVTLNKLCGQITMNGAALAAAAEVSFVVTNSTVAATDVVVVCVQSVGTAGSYFVTVGAVSAGSFAITVGNCSAGSLSQAVVLNFVVIKGVAA